MRQPSLRVTIFWRTYASFGLKGLILGHAITRYVPRNRDIPEFSLISHSSPVKWGLLSPHAGPSGLSAWRVWPGVMISRETTSYRYTLNACTHNIKFIELCFNAKTETYSKILLLSGLSPAFLPWCPPEPWDGGLDKWKALYSTGKGCVCVCVCVWRVNHRVSRFYT